MQKRRFPIAMLGKIGAVLALGGLASGTWPPLREAAPRCKGIPARGQTLARWGVYIYIYIWPRPLLVPIKTARV